MGILDRIADSLGEIIVPDDVRMHVELGATMLERGELDLAIRELRTALTLRPDHARAAWLLGQALLRRGDLAGAEEALEQAVSHRGDFAEALLALGETRRRRGRQDGAADAFRRALEAGLSDGELRGEAYRGLGAAWLELGRADRAVRELRKAVAERPGDAEATALLGRALLARGDLDAARICLERATVPEASLTLERLDAMGRALCALGEVYRRLDRYSDAEAAYVRALALASAQVVQGPLGGAPAGAARPDPASAGDGDFRIDARLGLSETRCRAGDAAGAHAHALQALAEAPKLGRGHLALGRALALARSFPAALSAYDRAAELAEADARVAILDEALHVALRAGLDVRAGEYGERLAAEAANSGLAPPPDTLAARAAALLASAATEGDPRGALGERLSSEAAELLAPAAGQETLELRLVEARIAELAGRIGPAAIALRRALELGPDDPRPRERLAALYRRGHAGAPAELPGILRAAHRLFVETRELGELGPEAARLIEVLDRPLLVTVMGEFNSGKSTFVNALLGEEVAPMGITPTTATINVLKYGAERGGRVVYRDDTTRDVPWREVPELLRGLDAAEARRIRLVEVLYPLETLQRVNVVDTPGLNSILPEHEQTAREFIAQADAILWIFSVGQAGKASEREALERIQGEHKKVLGVVNKIDRASTPEELAEILAHLTANFGELVEALVPFSAREALSGRADPERVARSNRAELDRVLEERFFQRSKSIKRASALRRIEALLADGTRRGEAAIDPRRREALDAARSAVRGERAIFARRFLDEERIRLLAALDELYGGAAKEVLDFVRPRSWAFGSNEAAPADRDFLLGLVEEQLAGLGQTSRVRVVAAAERAMAAVRSADPEAQLADPLRILDEQVYGRHRAYSRGFLRGGRADDFFTRILPKIDVTEASIRRALERQIPHLETLDAELLAPLRAWGDRFFEGLAERLRRLADAEERARFEVEERLLVPLSALRVAARALASPSEPAEAPPPAPHAAP